MTWDDLTRLDLIHDKTHEIKLVPGRGTLFALGLRLWFACLSGTGGRFFAFGPTLWGALSFLELLVVLVVVLVRFVQRVGLGWVRCSFCSCELLFAAFSSGRPGGYFFFGAWLVSMAQNGWKWSYCILHLFRCVMQQNRLVLFLFFSSLVHWTLFFVSGIFLTWFLIWLADWFIKLKKICPRRLFPREIPKFSRATCWHVMDAHVPYHNSWVLSFPHTHNGDTLVGLKSGGLSI